MKIQAAIVFSFLAGVLASFAESTVLVRSKLVETEEIWVGQQVILKLDVLGADGWASTSTLPRISVPGALVYRPPNSAVRLNETIDGTPYSGQQYEIWIYPQREGRFIVPPIEIETNVRVFGANGGDQPGKSVTAEVRFVAKAPPDWDPEIPLVTATRFEIDQNWVPDIQEATVGDGITREINMSASGVPGVVLPNLKQRNVAAVRLYPKQPSINDSIDRGWLNSNRTQSVTSVFQGEGLIGLPDLQVQWWDPGKENLELLTLPGVKIKVAPPKAISESEKQNEDGSVKAIVLWSLVPMILLWLAWIRRNTLARWWQARRLAFARSERRSFQALKQATTGKDPAVAYQALMAWIEQVSPAESGGPTLIHDFAGRIEDQNLAKETEALFSALNHRDRNWDGTQLLKAAHQARSRIMQMKKDARQSSALHLPELNHSK